MSHLRVHACVSPCVRVRVCVVASMSVSGRVTPDHEGKFELVLDVCAYVCVCVFVCLFMCRRVRVYVHVCMYRVHCVCTCVFMWMCVL